MKKKILIPLTAALFFVFVPAAEARAAAVKLRRSTGGTKILKANKTGFLEKFIDPAFIQKLSGRRLKRNPGGTRGLHRRQKKNTK